MRVLLCAHDFNEFYSFLERHIIKTTTAPIIQIPDRGRKKPKEKVPPPPPPPTPSRKKKKPKPESPEAVPSPMSFYPLTPSSPTIRTPPWILHQNEIPTDTGSRLGQLFTPPAAIALSIVFLAQ